MGELEGTIAAGGPLLDLAHAQAAFSMIDCEGNLWQFGEAQNGILIAFEELSRRLCVSDLAMRPR
jgi:hypothetical protein